jgi:hypothetical protein
VHTNNNIVQIPTPWYGMGVCALPSLKKLLTLLPWSYREEEEETWRPHLLINGKLWVDDQTLVSTYIIFISSHITLANGLSQIGHIFLCQGTKLTTRISELSYLTSLTHLFIKFICSTHNNFKIYIFSSLKPANLKIYIFLV